jgi:hypothetical protein
MSEMQAAVPPASAHGFPCGRPLPPSPSGGLRLCLAGLALAALLTGCGGSDPGLVTATVDFGDGEVKVLRSVEDYVVTYQNDLFGYWVGVTWRGLVGPCEGDGPAWLGLTIELRCAESMEAQDLDLQADLGKIRARLWYTSSCEDYGILEVPIDAVELEGAQGVVHVQSFSAQCGDSLAATTVEATLRFEELLFLPADGSGTPYVVATDGVVKLSF